MKKILICLTLVIGVLAIAAKTRVPKTVQGVPYTPTTADGRQKAAGDWEWTTPDDMAGDGNFTFDMIKNWTGEGENQAALVIQWNYDDEPAALVFGYRWDGQATGADMLKAVVRNNPRLYTLMQYTNVSSPTDPNGGYTINGIGWDVDDDGDIALIDTGNDNQVYESEDGFFEHPRGYKPGQGGSSDYDYDNWKARDTDDMWGAGWYSAYWSYWVKDDFSSKFSYSSWGASGRVLQNGSWDGWNFAKGMMASNWKTFVAAPLPIPADAKLEFENEGIYYSLKSYSKKTVKLVAPKAGSYAGEVTVPSTFVDEGVTYTVVEVADAAFANSAVTSVSLPATVTSIGKDAFKNSTLATLQVPSLDAITKFGTRVFSGCSNFSTLMIPSWMTAIPDRMFEGTAVASLAVPAQVETIGARAFASCSKLTEVDIPATVKTIGDEAFADADAITRVKVATTYPLAIGDGTFSATAYANATLELPNGYTADYAAADGWKNFANKSEYLLNVNVGDIFKVGGMTYAVTACGDANTVKTTYCKIEGKSDNAKVTAANRVGYEGEITVPAEVTYQGKTFKVTEMGDSTFYGASTMTSVNIQAPITALGKFAFYNCMKLTNVQLPATLKKLSTNAFAYCEIIESINLPEGVDDFGDMRTFCWCYKLKSINIPAGVTKLPDYCFYGTAIEEIELPSTIKTIGSNAFQSCSKLARVVLPEGLTSIPNYLFSSCKALTSVTIPETVTTIGNSAFENCNALELTLPSGITSIGSSAFKSCLKLTEFTVPSSMTVLPASLFYGCSNLVTVRISDKTTQIKGSVFRDCVKLANVVYADGQTGINLPPTLTLLDSYSFYGCKAVTTVELPKSIVTLGSYAFQNSGLKTLILPNKTVNYSQANIVQNCTGVKVYSAATAPGTCASYTWRITGTTNFAPVVVPTGYKDAYSKKNYWSKSTLTSPTLQGVKATDLKVLKRGDNLEITGKFAGIYDIEDMPESFVAANDAILFAGKSISLNYLAQADESLTRAVEGMTAVDATLGSDCSFAVTVPDTNKSSSVQVALEIANGESTLESETATVAVTKPFEFKTADYDAHFDESLTPELVFNSDEYALADLKFTSGNTAVASVNSRTGAVSVKRVEGDAVITAESKTDATVKATMTIHAALRNPVTGFVLGDGSKTINVTYLDILALSPTVEPANADIQTYDISVSDPEVATTYSVRAFNPSRSFYELITHKPGTVNVTFTAQDGAGVSSTYTVNVVEPDRTPLADQYQNGTFWLNEEWFGHTNGSINYITDKGELKYRVYESQNKYESFGCTSQYGIIHGDKLIVMSKQATDGGDPRTGGGRVVVADAKTLKKLSSFDEFANGGDGRACVGVSEDKVYLGSTGGIQVLNTKTLTLGAMVDGIPTGAQYSGQIGDMVAIGDYAFAIQQGVGVHAIDIATDKVVKTFPVADDETTGVAGVGYPQGITVTADGNVWVATTASASSGLGSFRCIDPSTLEVVDNVTLPEGRRVTCGWGAWRSTNFFASKKENAIWYGAGVDASIVSGNTGYYKWTVGSDITNIQPVFVFPSNLEGIDSKTFQAPYASVRYDDRTDQLLVAATHGASSNYRYNWLHFVDCKTGDISKTIRMKDYYWFPALPIFPDKYAPEFADVPEISVDLAKADDVCTIDLKEYVSDKDNLDAAIRLSLVDANPAANSADGIVDAELRGGVLTVKPVVAGHGSLSVKAESNGKTTTISLPYAVEDSASGINDVNGSAAMVAVTDNVVTVKGLMGVSFAIYDVAGRTVGAFVADSDCSCIALTLSAGVYVLTSADGSHTLKFAIK